MKLRYSAKAEKFFGKARDVDKIKILKKLQILTDDPLLGKKLKGEFEGVRVVRTWPYRILYLVQGETIYIINIQHRQQAYK